MASTKHTTSAALVAMATVVITSFVVAVLYIAQDILIPLALAALLSFLLSPLVTRLERWIGRIAAALLAVAILFGIVGGIGWVLTRQVLDLAARLPDYQENIRTKMRSLKVPDSGRFSKLSETVEALKKELPGGEETPAETAPAPTSSTTVTVPQRAVGGGLLKAPASSAVPTPVEIVETKRVGPLAQFGAVISPLVGPFGTGALVLLLLLCMLLQREDLRGRLIRLIGAGNISATTRGLDDAAKRVARYLLMQLVVNATYGVVIAVGLYFIGVPNAIVWGVLATVLRFIPYVGPWIAAVFPITLSLAVTNSWTTPALTVGLFVVVELLSNNVMEPLLYGASTGVSAIALIVAAVFWTWLWGAAGLVLATPLTVCLVVMGRHVPRLSILAVLLSDEEALAPHEEFYHRLLTPSATDAGDFAVAYLKANSRTALYDSVFIPVLATVERDGKSGELEAEQHAAVLQEMRDILEDLGTRPALPSQIEADKAVAAASAGAPPAPPAATCRVLSLPVRADRDEIAGAMLAQLLARHDFAAQNLSAKMTTGELLEAAEKSDAEAFCVSVAAPSTVIHARYLCSKLRARFPKTRLIVGLWGATEGLADATARLREAGADEVVTTLADAVVQLSKHAAALAQETLQLAPLADETERLAALHELQLLDTEAEPAFDRITTKLARILNVPIALITFIDRDRQFFKSQLGLPEDLARARQTPRDVSVCSHVASSGEILVVEDLLRDRRFAKSPLIRERGLRFYAGAPLRTAAGHTLGSLCVLDLKPRQFAEHEKRVLQVMAEEVMEAIHARVLARAVGALSPAEATFSENPAVADGGLGRAPDAGNTAPPEASARS